MNGKIYRFFISTIKGLEEVAADELKAQLPKLEQLHIEKGRRYGRIFFRYTRSPAPISQLLAPVNIWAVLMEDTQISVGQPGLERLCAGIGRTDLDAAGSLLKACGVGGTRQTYRLSVTCKGHHRFKRQALEKRVRTILEKDWALQPAQVDTDMRFHLELIGRRALWAIQLIPSRGRDILTREGLGGPLVYSIGRLLGGFDPDDIVLSKGLSPNGLTLLKQWQPHGVLVRVEQAIGPQHTGGVFRVRCGEQLPFGPGLIDLIVGLWDGKTTIQALLEQWHTIMREGGMLAICSLNAKAFLAALQTLRYPFAVMAHLPLTIHGRVYGLLLIERLLEREEEDGELLQIKGT